MMSKKDIIMWQHWNCKDPVYFYENFCHFKTHISGHRPPPLTENEKSAMRARCGYTGYKAPSRLLTESDYNSKPKDTEAPSLESIAEKLGPKASEDACSEFINMLSKGEHGWPAPKDVNIELSDEERSEIESLAKGASYIKVSGVDYDLAQKKKLWCDVYVASFSSETNKDRPRSRPVKFLAQDDADAAVVAFEDRFKEEEVT